jgi:peroxiredoxin
MTSGFTLAGCAVRRAVPDVEYTVLDGRRSRFAALRGHVVLVEFWATSCAVCVRGMPQIAATHRRFAAQGLKTLAVAMPYDAPARVAAFAEARALPFDVVIDNTGAVGRVFGDVEATPTTFLLDKRGAVVQRMVGEPATIALHRDIQNLLQEA